MSRLYLRAVIYFCPPWTLGLTLFTTCRLFLKITFFLKKEVQHLYHDILSVVRSGLVVHSHKKQYNVKGRNIIECLHLTMSMFLRLCSVGLIYCVFPIIFTRKCSRLYYKRSIVYQVVSCRTKENHD